MSIVRVGSTKQYAEGWEAAFSGSGRKRKQNSVSRGARQAPPHKTNSAKAKSAKKKSAKQAAVKKKGRR